MAHAAYHEGQRRAALDSMDLGIRLSSPAEIAERLRQLVDDFRGRHERELVLAYDKTDDPTVCAMHVGESRYWAGAADVAERLAEQHEAAAEKRPPVRRRRPRPRTHFDSVDSTCEEVAA